MMESGKRWMLTVQEIEHTDDVMIELPEDLLAQTGWQSGDTVYWQDLGDGTWSLSKKDQT